MIKDVVIMNIMIWVNVLMLILTYKLTKYNNPFGIKDLRSSKQSNQKDKVYTEENIQYLKDCNDRITRVEDALYSNSTDLDECYTLKEAKVALGLSSEQEVSENSPELSASTSMGNLSPSTQEFKESFTERIDKMKSELDNKSKENFLNDVPGLKDGFYEYDEDDIYMPDVHTSNDEPDAGIEIITEEYEKNFEEKLT